MSSEWLERALNKDTGYRMRLGTGLWLGLLGLTLGLIAWSGMDAEAQTPVTGRISSPFGWRTDPIHGQHRFHGGMDIAAESGTPVRAPQAGQVAFSGYYGGYGNVVVLHHGQGLYTLYGHNSALLVKAGDTVQRGQVIAQVGATGRATGPHLHFEVHYNKQYVNPAQYLSWLQQQNPSFTQTEAHQAQAAMPVVQQQGTTVSQAQRPPVPQRRQGRTVQLLNGTQVQHIQF